MNTDGLKSSKFTNCHAYVQETKGRGKGGDGDVELLISFHSLHSLGASAFPKSETCVTCVEKFKFN